jgi:hypothetical protein
MLCRWGTKTNRVFSRVGVFGTFFDCICVAVHDVGTRRFDFDGDTRRGGTFETSSDGGMCVERRGTNLVSSYVSYHIAYYFGCRVIHVFLALFMVIVFYNDFVLLGTAIL